jgi:hypothetical protein
MKASPVIKVLQGLCLVLYVLGLATQLGLWTGEGAVLCWRASLAMLAVHVLELAWARPWLALHPGPRWVSVLLTVLFGVLHWWPLKVRASQVPDDMEHEIV